jgi:hypothetical protein
MKTVIRLLFFILVMGVPGMNLEVNAALIFPSWEWKGDHYERNHMPYYYDESDPQGEHGWINATHCYVEEEVAIDNNGIPCKNFLPDMAVFDNCVVLGNMVGDYIAPISDNMCSVGMGTYVVALPVGGALFPLLFLSGIYSLMIYYRKKRYHRACK